MLPVLERLLYRPKQAPVTRVLVLTPTRELAVQIHQVSRQLAQYTNVDISLSAGIYLLLSFVPQDVVFYTHDKFLPNGQYGLSCIVYPMSNL